MIYKGIGNELPHRVHTAWLAAALCMMCFCCLSLAQDRQDRNSLDNVGGPDALGYSFVDNVAPDTATYNWIELRDNPGATQITGWTGGSNDGYHWVLLDFYFPSYGGEYINECTMLSISVNGTLMFCNTGSSEATNLPLPVSGDEHMIYAYWDNLVATTTGRGSVWFQNFASAHPTAYSVIEWDSVARVPPNLAPVTFQAILYETGRIKLQYRDMGMAAATTGTVGIQGNAADNYWLQYNYNDTGNPPVSGRAVWFYLPPGYFPDYSCTAITAPKPVQFPGVQRAVTLDIDRWPTYLVGSPLVYYQFNNGTVVQEQLDILHNDSHTFTTLLTMPGVGEYGIGAWVSSRHDPDRENDTTNAEITVVPCPTSVVNLDAGEYYATWGTTCGGAESSLREGESVVYQVNLLADGQWTFSLCGGDTTYAAELFLTTACDGGTVLASDQYGYFCANGRPEIRYQDLTAGTYFLNIVSYRYDEPHSCGPYDLIIKWEICPPLNDECSVVTPVSLPAIFTGDNHCATIDCNQHTVGLGETWHAFELPGSADVRVQYCGTLYNTPWANHMILFRGCPCVDSVGYSSTDYTSCSDGRITADFDNLAAGTYYMPVYRQSLHGAYTVHVFQSGVTARCCYGDPGTPLCWNATQQSCEALAGQWDQSQTCETNPCPIELQVIELVAQAIDMLNYPALYLSWQLVGPSTGTTFNIHRGSTPDFPADDSTLIATVANMFYIDPIPLAGTQSFYVVIAVHQ